MNTFAPSKEINLSITKRKKERKDEKDCINDGSADDADNGTG